MWNSTGTFVSSVIVSLNEETAENPQLGWTRGSSYDTTELLGQINELRVENDKLESKISELKNAIIKNLNKVENLACGSEKYNILGNTREKTYGRNYSIPYEVKLNWDEIFSAVGPYLISYINYIEFKNNLMTGITMHIKKS